MDRHEVPACGGLGGMSAGHMERPVCGIEALFCQFQCSTRRHLGLVGWRSTPVISIHFPDEYHGEL